MARYLALLRGIDVGGKNLIRMSDLKTCFEEHGSDDVTTYIQSGNVLFGSSERSSSGWIAPTPAVLYFSRLTSQPSRSQLIRIVPTPVYPQITFRTWNTTTQLVRIMDGPRTVTS